MLLMKITLNAFGDHFAAKKFGSTISQDFFMDEDDNDMEGCLSIQNPERIGVEYELESYGEWYVKFIETYYRKMKDAGMEEMDMRFDVFYSEQCNFEILGRNLTARLGVYNIAYPVSVYQTSSEELKKILSLRKRI